MVCDPLGFPRDLLNHAVSMRGGIWFEPVSNRMLMLFEQQRIWREVWTDGRELPKNVDVKGSPDSRYYGYSVGHWEGDTFVVETRGFNDRTPIDGMGHPRSEAMHVTERYRRRDFGHLDTELTFDDPEMYTRKITVNIGYELIPNNDIFEMFCTQNEKDRAHMVK